MKKILITIILLFLLNINVYGSTNDVLSGIEDSLYGFDYSHESTQKRVARLEKTIYGKISGGDYSKRIKKLSNDISADVIGKEIPPTRDTFLAEEETEDANVHYPIVEEIEQKLFNKIYNNRDFHTRIVTIEKKLFGKIYDVEDYSERMDRIKAKMYPDSIVTKEKDYGDGSYYNDDIIGSMDLYDTPSRKIQMPFGQKNYLRPYTNYGDNYTTDNTTKSNNSLDDNLAQLEYDMFGTEFSNDDTQTRIKRLNSASQAKKTSKKYDSQKFNQHLSTAMEIGAMILMILAMVL